jgi:hypothetical protein
MIKAPIPGLNGGRARLMMRRITQEEIAVLTIVANLAEPG